MSDALLAAVRQRDARRLAWLVRMTAHAARLNQPDDCTGMAPLHVAAALPTHSAAVLRVLLAAPAIDVNLPCLGDSCTGGRALHFAAEHSPTLVGMLLAMPGVDANAADAHGNAPIHVAARHGPAACLEVFLRERHRCGIHVNATNDAQTTPLHCAVLNRDARALRALLRCEDLVMDDARDQDGRTLLHHAAMLAEVDVGVEVLRLLLDHAPTRAHLNSRDDDGYTPLQLAAQCGRAAKVRVLLGTPGVDVTLRDDLDRTPLHAAAAGPDNGEILRLLLDHDPVEVARAQLNARDARGRTPLFTALEKVNSPSMRAHALEQVKLLAGCPEVDPNTADDRGFVALHVVATDTAFVRELLALPGIDPNRVRNETGQTPLHMAAGFNHIAVVELLLASPGIDVNARDSAGATPLLTACASVGKADVVRRLIRDPRVDLDAPDNRGRSPMHYLTDSCFEVLWDTKVCAACRREQAPDCPPASKLLMCACGLCYYCDAACQRRAWPRHGRVCPKAT